MLAKNMGILSGIVVLKDVVDIVDKRAIIFDIVGSDKSSGGSRRIARCANQQTTIVRVVLSTFK